MQKKTPPVGERGFTLVELLLAIFIFAIVVSSVYGSYRATFHVIQGSESRLDIANRARTVIERFSEDMGAIVTGPGGAFQGESQNYSGKRGDEISFVSSAHLVLRKSDTFSGPVLVEYQAEPDEDTGLLNLYRSDTLLLPGVETAEQTENRHLICRGLQEVKFTYRDQDGSETEDWRYVEVSPTGREGQSEESPFPVLVYIELVFAEFEESGESENSTIFKSAVALR